MGRRRMESSLSANAIIVSATICTMHALHTQLSGMAKCSRNKHCIEQLAWAGICSVEKGDASRGQKDCICYVMLVVGLRAYFLAEKHRAQTSYFCPLAPHLPHRASQSTHNT